ncbi:MAG: hypothetical protein DSZ28_05750 [Thiothrix sp.]|nr:MAG: hypothetical protein DSZ28_05750 [Thiothrix sp.]
MNNSIISRTFVVLACLVLLAGLLASTPAFSANETQPKVLIVYDSGDSWSAIDKNGIAQALDEIGMGHDLLNTSTTALTLTTLQNYPTVVLCEFTLSPSDITNVTSYVDGSGGVVVTGKAGIGLEAVLGISTPSPKSHTSAAEIRFENQHAVSHGAYWNGPIMHSPPMPTGEIPTINQFLYPATAWPAYQASATGATTIAHWYADANQWGTGQQEPAIAVNTFGSGRTVYTGALPGAYADPGWNWPYTWRVFVINAVEWASGSEYLAEVGLWPNANRSSLVWSGDTETTDMETAVPTLLGLFAQLGLQDFGTFYVVGKAGGDAGTEGAIEHPDIVKSIAMAGSEVGGHGDIHTGFGTGNLQQQVQRFRTMIKAINPLIAPFGESVKGFRAPHVEITRTTWAAAAQVGLLYDSSDIDVWSETTLPNFNGSLWEAPPDMPMDYHLFEVFGIPDADALAIYRDKTDYIYARRGMINWLHHPWVIDGHMSVLSGMLQHAINKGDIWMARQDAVVNWWIKRTRLSVQGVARSGDSVDVTVKNNGGQSIANATVWLKLRNGIDPASINATVGGSVAVTRTRSHNGMTFLAAIIPNISDGGSATVQYR